MTGEGSTIAIIRGLKVRVPVLDRFLSANNIDETYGNAPFYDKDPDAQSQLLRSKVGGVDTRTRIFIPSKQNHNDSNFAYVAYVWDVVYAQKEITLDSQLPADLPIEWVSLKDEILSFSTSDDSIWESAGHGKMGLFIIVSDGRRYVPPSFKQRITVGIDKYKSHTSLYNSLIPENY